MTPTPNPTATPAATPNAVGWIAPTEAGRAQQLLDTQPYLVAEQLELRWLPNNKLLTHAQNHLKAVSKKDDAADQRPVFTDAKKQAVAGMSQPLTELRGLLKKKFKKSYEAYYPQFGLEEQAGRWVLPRDHDDLLVALRDKLLPSLSKYGFDQDADTGTAVWQPLLTQLSTAHTGALQADATRSAGVAAAGPQDAETTRALRAIFHLAQAQFPDTWEATLRAWGWRKTGF